MRLFEHPDFEQAILEASEHFRARGLRAAIIEKDYYVTEALRAIALSNTNDIIIFKGGTSLSKGWNLIQRFSEDIDIFLDPARSIRPWERTASIGNSRSCAMPSPRTRRSRLSRTRVRPSADSGGTIVFLTRSVSAVRVKWRTAFSSKRAPPAAVNRPPLSSSVRTSASS